MDQLRKALNGYAKAYVQDIQPVLDTLPLKIDAFANESRVVLASSNHDVQEQAKTTPRTSPRKSILEITINPKLIELMKVDKDDPEWFQLIPNQLIPKLSVGIDVKSEGFSVFGEIY